MLDVKTWHQMEYDLIKLIPMDDVEFEHYLEKMVASYAHDIAQSRGEAFGNKYLDYAKTQITNILPKGRMTENHYLYSILKKNKRIGSAWFSFQNPHTFLHDIFLDKIQRRKGYGSEVLRQIEVLAREKGSDSIALHVFFFNKDAITFYENRDYIITGLQMFKRLSHSNFEKDY